MAFFSGFQTMPMLLSMAMAVEDNSEDAPNDTVSPSVVVKNTFIEFLDECAPKLERRCASAPPSLRSDTAHISTCSAKEGVSIGRQILRDMRDMRSPRSDGSSTADASTVIANDKNSSTEASDSSESDTASETSVRGEQVLRKQTWAEVSESDDESDTGFQASVRGEEMVRKQFWAEASESDDECGTAPMTRAHGEELAPIMQVSLANILPALTKLKVTAKLYQPATSDTTTPLASSAKLFQPAKHNATTPLAATAKLYQPAKPDAIMPSAVRRKFAEVVASGLGCLKSATAVERGEMLDGTNGWTLKGHLRDHRNQSIEKTLESVKQQLLAAAGQSDGVYIIGYESTPFVPDKQRRFCHAVSAVTAQLALVQDESQACWDFVGKGCCSRGCGCRWEHPQWQTQIRVELV